MRLVTRESLGDSGGGQIASPAFDVDACVAAARIVQQRWSQTPLAERVRILRRFRELLAVRPDEFIAAIDRQGRTPAETLAAEIVPLADAARFLERNLSWALKPRRERNWSRWIGLSTVSLEIRRQPIGVVLIIGPANYPLFLPGVQILQAVAAGNTVLVKPGIGGEGALRRLARLLGAAGLPQDVVQVLDESPRTAQSAIAAGVDKVFLTGSYETGRNVLEHLATHVTPSVMELSGCDALLVLPNADLQRVASCIKFATRFNQGETCIAPRRFLAHRQVIATLRERMPQLPWREFATAGEAIEQVNASQYALGLSIFGNVREARELASHMHAGCVTINDLVAPTADARLPFGGRKRSGFGVTRGLEGLLEMTVMQAVAVRHGRWLPHLQSPGPHDAKILAAWLQLVHTGSLSAKFAAIRSLVQAIGSVRKSEGANRGTDD